MGYAYPGTFAAHTTQSTTRVPFLRRLMSAIADSRMRSVQREINSRAYLFDEMHGVLGDLPATSLRDDVKLPFVR